MEKSGSKKAATSGKFDLQIDRDWCKACGICIEVCPKKVFDPDWEQKPLVSRLEDCIGCNLCEQLCPDLAVTVHLTPDISALGEASDE